MECRPTDGTLGNGKRVHLRQPQAGNRGPGAGDEEPRCAVLRKLLDTDSRRLGRDSKGTAPAMSSRPPRAGSRGLSQNAYLRAGPQQAIDQLSARVDQRFAIVEDQQQSSGAEGVGQRLGQSTRGFLPGPPVPLPRRWRPGYDPRLAPGRPARLHVGTRRQPQQRRATRDGSCPRHPHQPVTGCASSRAAPAPAAGPARGLRSCLARSGRLRFTWLDVAPLS